MAKTCPKCENQMVEAVVVAAGTYYVRIGKKPVKAFGWRKQSCAINQFACPKCGYVEMYAEQPDVFAKG